MDTIQVKNDNDNCEDKEEWILNIVQFCFEIPVQKLEDIINYADKRNLQLRIQWEVTHILSMQISIIFIS